MKRHILIAMLLASMLTSTAQAAPQASTPIFDVSTIKPSNIGDDSMSINWNENTFKATNISIESLLENAFGIRQDLISGLPNWAKSAHYDVLAKASDTDPAVLKSLTDDQQRDMLKRFVETRFHLKSHIEVKQLPVYDLVPAKGGIKFAASAAKPGTPACKGGMSSSATNMSMDCVPLETLRYFLAYRVQRNVIDKTGLPPTGVYDLKLKWRPQQDGPLSDADAQLPTIFDALQEQIGLKLVSSKGPVETLVIDQIEKPTEN